MSDKEFEWQFDAHDLRPVVRWLEARRPGPDAVEDGGPAAAALPTVAFLPVEPREILDTYFDTPDWRFHRAGLALRLRACAGTVEAALKTREPALDGGLRKRTEIQAPLASAEPQALLESETRPGLWARSLAAGRSLEPLFRLNSARQAYAILLDGQAVGEVVLDETTFESPAPRQPLKLLRVEVETAPSSLDALRPYVDDMRGACHLTPAASSKYELGLLSLERTPIGFPDVGPVEVTATSTVGELGYAVLRRAFLAFLRSEPGTRVGEDPEALHDMRVASRRMRAAFRLFEPVFPLRTRTLVSELRWLAGLLGGVRDLDIQLAWLTTWSDSAAAEDQAPLWHLSETLETRRQRARRKLLQGLDSNRYERLVTRLTRLLQSGPPRRSRAARTPALAVVPGLIELRAQSAVKGGKGLKSSAPPEAFHRLRIRCKRLRYAIENARDLYGAPANDYIQDLVRIQDVLGLHQDAVVASGRLQELLHTSPRLPPRVIFTMGRAAQRYDQQAARLRKRFLKVYPRLQGKNWTRLKKAMDKGQAGLVTTEWPPPPRSAAPAQPPMPAQER